LELLYGALRDGGGPFLLFLKAWEALGWWEDLCLISMVEFYLFTYLKHLFRRAVHRSCLVNAA
jgi:hypothetical protein